MCGCEWECGGVGVCVGVNCIGEEGSMWVGQP